jgi:3-hydroxyacyl-CoA dehydrogenase
MLNERIERGVALLTMDNPPVNGLSLGLRQALWAAIERLEADASVHAIVVTGSAKAFSGGADIREFGRAEALAEPNLPALTQRIEACAKPVVAAVGQLALGGGLELALACHHRVVAEDARLGLPEVQIGLLPGAGGTQRLPRAIGLEQALQLISSGNPERASRLAEWPGQALIDACVPAAELVERALAFAAQVRSTPRLSERPVAPQPALLEAARARAAALPYPAPRECVEAVAASIDRPFADGLAAERAGFQTLMRSPESAALRHAFFAERAATKVPGVEADTPRRAIRQVAVLGAGTMGAGIATACLMAGLRVDLIDAQAAGLERGLKAIDKHLAGQVDKGRISAVRAEQLRAQLRAGQDDAVLAEADLVIEAVFENLDRQGTGLPQLDAVCKPGAILASNTSYPGPQRSPRSHSGPQDVIGLHFFSPANVMRLLEVVRGAATSAGCAGHRLEFGKKHRQGGVVAGVCDGFIGNRMLARYGAAGERSDRRWLHAAAGGRSAWSASALRWGRSASIDLAGLTSAGAIRQAPRKEAGTLRRATR